MKARFLIPFFAVVLLSALNAAEGQQPNSTHQKLTRADSAAINALVLYPDTIRLDIFEACKYPEVIVRLANEQKNSSIDFASLVSSYSKQEQDDIWDLSRYPNLISRLVEGGKKSPEEIDAILVSYPGEIHETALKYGRNYYDVLSKIDALQTRMNATFDQVIADYPSVTQDAFRELIQLPEVLTLLNDHLNITVLPGDRYRRDPQWVIHRADSMNLALTRQHAEDVAAWQDSIQNNPDAENDLKNAANDYAQEQGYTQDELNAQPDNTAYTESYTCYPYSYWFGYPTWYPYYYWYPYPYWYDWGFYYDSHRHFRFIGLPSYNFTNWYFHYPEHWHRYPHLANTYVNHYYGPRRGAATNNTVIVHKWVRDNKSYLPHDFITNRAQAARVETIRQLGQMNVDVQKRFKENNITAPQRDQYFQSNRTKYPALNATPQQKFQETEKQQIRIPDVIQPPVKQPPARLPQFQQQPPQRQEQPERKQTPVQPAPPVYNYNNINRAQDYHRNTWEQAPVARPQQAPAPMRQSAPQPIRQSAPQPIRQSAPQPMRQSAPAPVRPQPKR